MARAGLHTRQLSFARPLLAAAFRVHLPAGIRADLPHGLRRFRLLPVPYPGVLGQAVLAGARRLPVRLQSAGTDHLQNVPRACALRAASRPRERGVSQCGDAEGDVPAASLAAPPQDRAADLRIRHVFQAGGRPPGRASGAPPCLPRPPRLHKTALLIFEFGTFSKRAIAAPGEFLERLDPFLAALPPHFRYAVEVRNPEFLEPDYFACLRARGVAHVYNAWTRMPELRRQVEIPGSATAGFLVCRALLRQGRPYEEAVARFSPYSEIRDPNPGARESLR